jgi:hypothetical protein
MARWLGRPDFPALLVRSRALCTIQSDYRGNESWALVGKSNYAAKMEWNSGFDWKQRTCAFVEEKWT